MSDESIRHAEERFTGAAAHDSVEQQSPGSQMAARREQLGWTVEQVAARLNLAPRQIEAIEADNHAVLPGIAVTRGFIRAYAKLLSIDAAPLVAGLTVETPPLEEAVPLRRPLPAAAFVPGKLAPIRRGGKPWVAIVLALVLIALIGGYAAHQAGLLGQISDGVSLQLDTRLDSSAAAQPSASTDSVVQVALPSVESGAASTVTSTAAPDVQLGVETLVPPTASVPTAPAAIAATQEQAASPEQTAGSPLIPDAATAATPTTTATAMTTATTTPTLSASAATGNRKMLVLKAIEDCWVEIRKADNTALLSKTLVAGTTERIELDGPVSAVFGNAGGIEATLRGEPVDIRSRAKNNVARISLG